MNARNLWSQVLLVVGGIGMLAGAVDPLEGSIAILLGSGLFALGTYLGQAAHRLTAYRAAVFALIAAGVAALWGLSAVGGFGGSSGHSAWWGLLTLPYVVGWLMAIGGPSNPRWFSLLGIPVGLWYLVLPGMILSKKGRADWGLAAGLAAIGVVAIAGCIYRLIHPAPVAASRS